MRDSIGRPYEIDGLVLALDASVGIALFPDQATTAEGLVKRADHAMYEAKAARTGIELYAPERDASSRERLALSGELRRAIDSGELELHYQPMCDPRTGRPVAVEALVRWRHPERGLLFPGDFLDLAERTGAMRDLTLTVSRLALAQCRDWWHDGIFVRMSVNLAPQNVFDLRLPEDVAGVLADCGLPASALMLEITEDTIMADPVRGMGVLAGLGELGVGLALDDFGTGYSSLAYLKRLPVEELKIDRSFVSRMVDDHDDGAIVRSIVDLARSLQLRVVAEGVEDLATWTRLTELGCEVIQGFGVSPPLPAAELTPWLARRMPGVRAST